MRQVEEVLPGFGYKDGKAQETVGGGNSGSTTVREDAQVFDSEPERQEAPQFWSGRLSKLKYKCEAGGVRFAQADRWFPSTKLCCGCGQVQAMPLNGRTYSCDCGMALDRDLNAARNLERYAAGSSSEAQNGRGGQVRPSSGGSGLRSVNRSTGLSRSGQIVEIRSDF